MAVQEADLEIVRHLKNQVISLDEDRKIRKIILYGSRALGSAHPDSDFDLLVVETDPVSKRAEMHRLRQAINRQAHSVDIWVMGNREFEETKNVIGGLAYPANKYGLVLYENA